jgi:hypothetical protein
MLPSITNAFRLRSIPTASVSLSGRNVSNDMLSSLHLVHMVHISCYHRQLMHFILCIILYQVYFILCIILYHVHCIDITNLHIMYITYRVYFILCIILYHVYFISCIFHIMYIMYVYYISCPLYAISICEHVVF